MLRVLVTAASVPERTGGKQLLQKVKAVGQPVWRLQTIWADSGFSGVALMMWVMDFCHFILEVVRRPEQRKGFLVLRKRCVVERTFGWLMRCKRLVRDYELLPETSETFIYLVMIHLLVRRLA